MPTIQQPGSAATPRPAQGGPSGQADAALTSALDQAGLLAGGKNPTAVGKELVKNLLSRGFYGGMGALPSQVKKALAAFQTAKGLPVTGKLDAATLSALGQLGLLPGGAQAARRPGGADGFDRPVAKVQDRTDIDLGRGTTGGDGAAGQADAGAQQPSLGRQLRQSVQALLGRFGLGGGAGKAGEAPAGSPGGQAAAEGQAQADAAGGHQAASTTGGSANAASTRGQAADGAHVPQTRSDALGDKTSSERGTKGDPAAEKGRAKKKGDKAGQIGDDDDEEGARQQGQGEGGAGGEGEAGHETDPGNASSGDDDLSGERGHASSGDDDDAEAGHYRIPTLAEQLNDALALVVREAEGMGAKRAVAYSLKVTFYRPGVYGPGQKAPELLHAEVERADAFDPAWDELVEGLQRMTARYAPGTPVPDRDAWGAALRRARYRDR